MVSEGHLCLWDTQTWKVLHTIELPRQLCLWDTQTWKVLHTIELPRQLCLWGTQKRKVLPSIRLPRKHVRRLASLAISPDSKIIATNRHDKIELWSIDTGEFVAKVNASSQSMVFAPNWAKSSIVALQQEDGLIQTWFLDISQPVPELQHIGHVFDDVTISPDSRFVASTHRHGSQVSVWSGDDGQLVHVLEGGSISSYSPFNPLIFSPDSQLLAYVGGSIQIWIVENFPQLPSRAIPNMLLLAAGRLYSYGR
ncbi:hypothetical protein TrVGV298_002901 [Trichoderma virens]|nr:hypothetical protein TrVGV298_002901 [Trichoderma virens]